MGEERSEDWSLEVLDIPDFIEDDFLWLYFENTHRSGGGRVVSLVRMGGWASLEFEEASAAERVLAKASHVLSGATVTVRRARPKDGRTLLLSGLNPTTPRELLELYVENVTGTDPDGYTLHISPRADRAIICLQQPLPHGFEHLSARVLRKCLDGASLVLEQVDATDSVLVENLGPSMTEDMLTLYFESLRGGHCEVTRVSMLAVGAARVTFSDHESVQRVLGKSHTLDKMELRVEPYFPLLLADRELVPTSILTAPPTPMPTDPPTPISVCTTMPTPTVTAMPIATPAHTAYPPPMLTARSTAVPKPAPRSRPAPPPTPNGMAESVGGGSYDAVSVLHTQTTLTVTAATDTTSAVTTANNNAATVTPATVTTATAIAAVGVAQKVVEVIPPSPAGGVCEVPVHDPIKLRLLTRSDLLQRLRAAHPAADVCVSTQAVCIAAPDPLCAQTLRSAVLEFLGGVAQTRLPLPQDRAELLAREDVRQRVLSTLTTRGSPAEYSVSGGVAVVTAESPSAASGACDALASLISTFSMPLLPDQQAALHTDEGGRLLRSLPLCRAALMDGGCSVAVVTLTGTEEEIRARVAQFLGSPIQREAVLSVEPGMLHYIQMHQHQLLADMNQLTFLPLDAGDGLSIQGEATACQMAEEVLSSVVESTHSRTLTVSAPGVARYLLQSEGSALLQEMTRKFEVFISLEQVVWEPPEETDVVALAWRMMANQNIQRNSSSSPASMDPNASDLSATDKPGTECLVEATRIWADIGMAEAPALSLRLSEVEEDDLYTAGDDPKSSMTPPGLCPPSGAVQGQSGMAPPQLSLDDDVSLSLAIQLSMETSWAPQSDCELQKVLELSLWEDAQQQKVLELSLQAAVPDGEDAQLQCTVEECLQDAIRVAGNAQLRVFAAYTHDIIRVDIALGKRVELRHCEERVQHSSLRRDSAHLRLCLLLLQRKHAVDIQVQGTTATISGFRDFVAEATLALRSLLKQMATVPGDAEVLRTVQWAWREQGAAMATLYPPGATVIIENAWRTRQRKIDILLDGQACSIDLERMQELSTVSGRSVAITRTITSKDLHTDTADEDYSLLAKMPEASRVDEGSFEFQEVVREFYDSIQEHHNKIQIIKVEKLTNSLLNNQYKLKRASLLQSAQEADVERTLFHGTSETSVKEICIHGFNRSFCGKNATMYGQGVYFAVNSALSVQDTYSPPNAEGHKFVFVAKVLTGDFTVGKHAMKVAPLKDGSDIPVRHHSVVDNVSAPTIFVIFNDTQAYPEYLITCHRIKR